MTDMVDGVAQLIRIHGNTMGPDVLAGLIVDKVAEEINPVIGVAISSLKYCEDKYGHDNMARLNVETGWQALKKKWGVGGVGVDKQSLIREFKAILDNAGEIGLATQATAELLIEELEEPDIKKYLGGD